MKLVFHLINEWKIERERERERERVERYKLVSTHTCVYRYRRPRNGFDRDFRDLILINKNTTAIMLNEWNFLSVIIISFMKYFKGRFYLKKSFKHPYWRLLDDFSRTKYVSNTKNVRLYYIKYFNSSHLDGFWDIF